MELLIGILGAGIGSGAMAILLAVIQRKWVKQDRTETKKDKYDEKIDAVVAGLKVLTIDRVRELGKCYISDGEINLEDKENLEEMYLAYKDLGGNGHLKIVMNEVERLQVIDK